MHEITKVLDIRLEFAGLKHSQTVGVVQRSRSVLKRILKLNTIRQWNDWFKYVQLATFIHNTSYHSTIGCGATILFHVTTTFGEPQTKNLRFSSTSIERFLRIVNKFSNYKMQWVKTFSKGNLFLLNSTQQAPCVIWLQSWSEAVNSLFVLSFT